MSYLMNNYQPLDIEFVKGSGCWLFDANGDKYLDAISGIGVVGLGHCHKNITKAIQKQASKLIHTSNCYRITNQENLGKKLCTIAGMDKVFFANSGAEANEAAIKITRLYAYNNNIKKPIILTANKSFHGRTMATLSATGNPKIQNGFTPLLDTFIYINFNDINAIKSHSKNPDIVALMLEPVQGESGVIIPNKNYLNEVAQVCKNNNWLLILDEVQTGMGRTGKMFCHQYNNITPDILTLAKGLGNGVPISACLAKNKIANVFQKNSHGSTFGGNPLVCQAALTVISTIEKDNILKNVNQIGQYLLTNLKIKLKKSKKVVEIRALGLMLAIELNQECLILAKLSLEQKLLINITGRTIRILPPLIIKKHEADIIINTLCTLINKL